MAGRHSIRALSTLASGSVIDRMAKAIEQAGVPAKDTEAITSAMVTLVNQRLRKEMDKFVRLQDHNSTIMQDRIGTRNAELELQVYKDVNVTRETVAKDMNEIKAKSDKDLSGVLEMVNKEVCSIQGEVQSARNDLLKFSVGLVVSLSAVGLAVLRYTWG